MSARRGIAEEFTEEPFRPRAWQEGHSEFHTCLYFTSFVVQLPGTRASPFRSPTHTRSIRFSTAHDCRSLHRIQRPSFRRRVSAASVSFPTPLRHAVEPDRVGPGLGTPRSPTSNTPCPSGLCRAIMRVVWTTAVTRFAVQTRQ